VVVLDVIELSNGLLIRGETLTGFEGGKIKIIAGSARMPQPMGDWGILRTVHHPYWADEWQRREALSKGRVYNKPNS
jgi:hypothetical protein